MQIPCAAFLGSFQLGTEVEVEWSTSATGANISNQPDSPFNQIDLKTLILNGVDSDYCGVYTCTETVISNYSVSENLTLNVGEFDLTSSLGSYCLVQL